MDLRQTKMFLTKCFMVMIIAFVIATFVEFKGFAFLMIGTFIVWFAVYLIFLRCPYCKKHIGKMSNRKCKHCGKDLYQ